MMNFRVLQTMAGVASVLALVTAATPAAAQATLYAFASPPATMAQTVNHTTCTVGTCTAYPPNSVITIRFTTATPLAPNLVDADISTLVTDYVLTDGVNTMVPTDPQVSLNIFSVSTNSAGQVTASTIDIYRWQGAKVAGGRIDNIYTSGGLVADAYVNGQCAALGPGTAATSPADNCGGNGALDSDSSRISPAAGAWLLPPTIPTMSEWAMILFGLMLAGGAALHLQRRANA